MHWMEASQVRATLWVVGFEGVCRPYRVLRGFGVPSRNFVTCLWHLERLVEL